MLPRVADKINCRFCSDEELARCGDIVWISPAFENNVIAGLSQALAVFTDLVKTFKNKIGNSKTNGYDKCRPRSAFNR